jgi:hypothetical protein
VDRELDAVSVDDDGRVLAIGSCKWTTTPMPYTEKTKLDALATHLAGGGDLPQLYFFARRGFVPQLAAEAAASSRIHLVTPEDMLPST